MLIGALAALWVAIGVTATLTLSQSDPEAALALWSPGVKTKVAIASRSLDGAAGSEGVAHALALSRSALAREPVNAEAARNLALALAFSDQGSANRMFAYAERLSRRDLATQLWLIQASVDKGDVKEALRHYDRALRTSERAADILYPTLVAAADDPRVAVELGRVLAARPAWWRDFFIREIDGAKNPASLRMLVAASRIDTKNQGDAEIARLAITKLVDQHAFDDAGKLYAAIANSAPKPLDLVRDSKFAGGGISSPFDWSITDQPDPSALLVDDGGRKLQLRSTGKVDGEVAHQLLVLRPGAYTLSGTFGFDAGTSRGPVVQLRCTQGQEITSVRLVANGTSATRFNATFVVGEGCPAQWLAIQMTQGVDASAWISEIDIAATTGK